jgi:asparagine synthase (glutamine-hydrolysing)
MTETLRHRGPDGEGGWVDAAAGIALGHRRLAIVDLSDQGRQPMHSSCSRWVLSFNGEVYNFRELRAELEARAHRFRGTSDTEVMVESIAEWGVDAAVCRFVGMFAFAAWDRDRRELHLVRDRLGIKPLYCGWMGSTFLFASELKALRAHPAFRVDVDRDALAAFARHGYVPAPRSIYRGVHKLLPGTIRTIAATGEDRARVYWSANDVAVEGLTSPFRGSTAEATEELERRLRQAVRLRMIADVPLGAFLSGGVDSSTIVALMQSESGRAIRTFTIGFSEPGYDESRHAAAIARHLGTHHTELTVEPADALAVVSRLPELYDEPFADSSEIPTFLLSRLTRDHVTVALSGDGADELFAGYDRYFRAAAIHSSLGRVPLSLRRVLRDVLRRIPTRDAAPGRPFERFVPLRLSARLHDFANGLAFTTADDVALKLSSHWASPDEVVLNAREAKGILWETGPRQRIADFVRRWQFLDLVTYLPDDILVKIDRASMAVGLEARVPFLDHRVVEFALTLPIAGERENERKSLLRRILHRYVPAALVDRPKMGFGVPIDHWLRGPLRDWAENLLDERRLDSDGFFAARPIRRAWDEHLAGVRNRQYLLWDVLMFQAWKERWL